MSELPTLYEYYTGDGIQTGLSTEEPHFTLNNKKITIRSGAMHYFRVPPEYWRDRLRKMRAVGLNAVETYMPWNLHEPLPDSYDFGDGGTDFQNFLDVGKFLKTAQEEDLLVMLRPGPYICAEWDFGGLPSWLLRDPNMKVRTSNANFMERVQKYFRVLFKLLVEFQFTKGGPIIAFQIENEYGNVKVEDEDIDVEYLETLKEIYSENGIVEMLFTSDTPSNGNYGSLPGVLYTANFQDDPEKELSLLQMYQPGKPSMVMEYWTGWFDHWTESHHTRSCAKFADVLERILQFPASVNMYMFHGGTNWGFMNGGNLQDSSTDNSSAQHDTSSYDYDAPLTEAGDYTEKFFAVRELLAKYEDVHTKLPPLPKPIERVAYEKVAVHAEMSLDHLLRNIKPLTMFQTTSMEMLDLGSNYGQSHGYIVYRKTRLALAAGSVLKITGHVCDTVIVLINGQLASKVLQNKNDLDQFGYWRLKDSTLNLGDLTYDDATLDLVVENFGRANYGKLDQFNQFKGLWQGDVSVNDVPLCDWEVFPVDFKKTWVENVEGWSGITLPIGPVMYKATLAIPEARDTFLDMRNWTKGIVVVNGFVLSRYCKLGPQQTAYLPAPLLRMGDNEIVIFEHFEGNAFVEFSKDPIYETLE